MSCVGLAQTPTDELSTAKTANLFTNLRIISQSGFLFGHQDDDAYGVGWTAIRGRSDVKESVGSYPAVHGWDLGSDLRNSANIDGVDFQNMSRWMKDVYKRGGINTISWHLDNLSTGGNSWDTTATVKDILPGGSKHGAFVEQLDLMADFLKGLKSWLTKIPVIIRPWHEHNGGWFWWGKGHCTEQEYIALFRFTVDYLKNEKDIHHVLYAFSPDRSQLQLDSLQEARYFYGYPGDEYVDIIGLDNYADVGRIGGMDDTGTQQKNFVKSLQLITHIAEERKKVAALSETGLEGVTESNWFTQRILLPITEEDSIRIAWVLVWRNHNKTHHYAPYPTHSSEKDFLQFYQNPHTYFESDLNNPYQQNKLF